MKKINLFALPGNARFVLLVLLAVMTVTIVGCGPTVYIIPDYREFTTGGIFIEKYWSSFSGGKGVKLEGRFDEISTEMLNGTEQLKFTIDVPNGLQPVTVYADPTFASQLYAIHQGRSIVVYGTTKSISVSSRLDGGKIGDHLAVQLDKLEVR